MVVTSMPRTKKPATDEGAASAAPESTTPAVSATAPKTATRVRALAHIRRAAGSVDANTEFTPTDDKERRLLLELGYAEEL